MNMAGMDNKKKLTLKDIAEKVGTSSATVHRVIYGKEGVGADLRKQILEEIEKSGYVIDKAASNLGRDTQVIDVLIPKAIDEDRFFGSELMKGIQCATNELSQERIVIQFKECLNGSQKISEDLENLYDSDAHKIQGLITLCDDDKSIDWIRRFVRIGVKVVLITNIDVKIPEVYTVKIQEKCMGAVAARLANLLCKKIPSNILVVNGNTAAISCQHYVQSFCEHLENEHKFSLIEGKHFSDYRDALVKKLSENSTDLIYASGCRATYNVSTLLSQLQLKNRPLLVGSDLIPEVVPYLENGILTATCNQSIDGQERVAVLSLFNLLTDANYKIEDHIIELPIGVIFKENYKGFID